MRSRAAALGLGLALLCTPALAQGDAAASRKPKRTPPAAASTEATAPAASAPTLPPLPGAARLHPSTAGQAPSLRSAVRARWSTAATVHASGQGTCRAQCATTRLACRTREDDDPPVRCDAAWTSCLSTCGGLTYGRAPPDGG